MKVNTMRTLDRLVGTPLCFILSCICKVVRPFQRRPQAGDKVERLLMVKLAEMGNTVLFYPALEKARETWPDVEFYFLVFEENVSAVNLLGVVPAENIFTIRSSNLVVFLCDTLSCVWRLRKLRLSAAIDLEFFSRATGILAAVVGARAIVGYERQTMEGLYKGSMLTHPVQYNCHMHTASSFVTLVEALGEDVSDVPLVKTPIVSEDSLPFPEFIPTVAEKEAILERMTTANAAYTADSCLIILNVNSSELMPLRRWALDRYGALAKELLKRPKSLIVLTGIESERPESERMVEQLGKENCVNLVGRTSLRELVVLYTFCRLMVTNDSGPSHFANLTELPTITLFGPESPILYRPLGKNKRGISANLACSPCVSAYNHRKSNCNNNVCMQAVTVDQVLSVCNELLEA